MIALALTCCALAVAACGSSSKSTTTAGSSPAAAGLKFSACMRSHGVPNFPDPTSNGSGPGLTVHVDKRSPAFQNAEQACGSLQAAVAEAKPRPTRRDNSGRPSACARTGCPTTPTHSLAADTTSPRDHFPLARVPARPECMRKALTGALRYKRQREFSRRPSVPPKSSRQTRASCAFVAAAASSAAPILTDLFGDIVRGSRIVHWETRSGEPPRRRWLNAVRLARVAKVRSRRERSMRARRGRRRRNVAARACGGS